MLFVLKTSKDVKKIKEQLAKRHGKRNFDAKRSCGSLKVNGEGLAIQKQARNEWDSTSLNF